MDVLRAALGEEQLTYLGASYGTKLGATYAELFPDRVGRLVLDGAVDVVAVVPASWRSSQAARVRDRAARRTSRTASRRPTPASSATRSTRGCSGSGTSSTRSTQQPLPTGSRPRARPRGNAFYGIIAAALRAGLLVPASARRSAQGFDGDGAALLQLADLYALPQRRRHLHLQLDGGVLRDQLPRRPVRDRAVDEVADQYPDFEAASPTLGRFFAWAPGSAVGGWQVDSGQEPLRHRRGRRRPDRGRRHHPRPGHAVRLGGRRSPTSSTPACWSPATATVTPATTPATSVSTRRSRTTWSTAPCPRTA